MKKITALILCIIMLLCLAACGDKTEVSPTGGDSVTVEMSVKDFGTITLELYPDIAPTGGDSVTVEMSVKDFGTITLELYPDIAPITVDNFVSLAKSGFYDGLTFHRVVKDFMIQGGDPEGNGTGGSDKTIKGEFSANGVENSLSHERGVISMARSQSYDSASSQFFICHGDSQFLDGQYAAFGKVVDGMDVVDKIADVEVKTGLSGEKSTPVDTVVIEYVKVIED